MENRGVTVPKAIQRWIHLVNEDGSGKDVFVHPSGIDVEIRNAEAPRLRIKSVSTTAIVEGDDARELIDWLNRVAGIVVEARV